MFILIVFLYVTSDQITMQAHKMTNDMCDWHSLPLYVGGHAYLKGYGRKIARHQGMMNGCLHKRPLQGEGQLAILLDCDDL